MKMENLNAGYKRQTYQQQQLHFQSPQIEYQQHINFTKYYLHPVWLLPFAQLSHHLQVFVFEVCFSLCICFCCWHFTPLNVGGVINGGRAMYNTNRFVHRAFRFLFDIQFAYTHVCLENIWILIATDAAVMQMAITKRLQFRMVFLFGCQILDGGCKVRFLSHLFSSAYQKV